MGEGVEPSRQGEKPFWMSPWLWVAAAVVTSPWWIPYAFFGGLLVLFPVNVQIVNASGQELSGGEYQIFERVHRFGPVRPGETRTFWGFITKEGTKTALTVRFPDGHALHTERGVYFIYGDKQHFRVRRDKIEEVS